VLIPKITDGGVMKAGSPGWMTMTNVDGSPTRPVIRCNCGALMNINNHHVHADGRVTASFLHGAPVPKPCGWHVFIELEGYDGPEFLPERS